MSHTALQSEDVIVAQAFGMAATGHSARQIEAEIGVDHATIARWLQRDELRQELSELTAQYIAIAGDDLTAKWTQINHRIADEVLDGTRDVTIQQAMVAYGIGKDKSYQLRQATGPNINVQYVIIQPPFLKDVTNADS